MRKHHSVLSGGGGSVDIVEYRKWGWVGGNLDSMVGTILIGLGVDWVGLHAIHQIKAEL